MLEFKDILFAPEWSFLRFAILTGLCLSPALGVVGTMVVTRRISSLAGASTHAALGGFGLAIFLQRVCLWQWFTPTLGAVIGAVTAAVAVGIVSIYAKEREDTIIGAVWAIGMSIGLLFLDRTPGYVDWQGYLFGSILLLTSNDIYMTLILDAVILIPAVIFFPSLLAMSFDDTFAKLRGIKVTALYIGLLILTALTIVLLINLVGIMLVIALLTLPAAAAGCCTSHLQSMMIVSGIFNALFVVAGLIASSIFSLPSGPTIVVISGVAYVAALGIKRLRTK
jgi:zinc transport system permease protein